MNAAPAGEMTDYINLHEIAWQLVPADESATLDYFMADYVGHLHHYLRQIRALLRPQPDA
jgi:hypothetical protein